MKIASTDGSIFKEGVASLNEKSLNNDFSYMEIAVSKLPAELIAELDD